MATVTCVRPWKVTRRLVPEINSGEAGDAARAMLTAVSKVTSRSPKVTSCVQAREVPCLDLGPPRGRRRLIPVVLTSACDAFVMAAPEDAGMGDIRRLVLPIVALTACGSLSACYMGPDPVQYAALGVVDGKATAVVALCGRSSADLSVDQDDDDPADTVSRDWSLTVYLAGPAQDVDVELLGVARRGWEITSPAPEDSPPPPGRPAGSAGRRPRSRPVTATGSTPPTAARRGRTRPRSPSPPMTSGGSAKVRCSRRPTTRSWTSFRGNPSSVWPARQEGAGGHIGRTCRKLDNPSLGDVLLPAFIKPLHA